MKVVKWVGGVLLIAICTAFAVDFALKAGHWEENVSARMGLWAILIVAIPLLTKKSEKTNKFIPKEHTERKVEKKLKFYMSLAMSGVILGFVLHANWLT